MSKELAPASPRWALYARAATPLDVRAQLGELRTYIEGDTGGITCVACFDVGRPGPGRQALLARAGIAWPYAI
ncbi:hypothetical protein [Nonomuraea sp. NPDC052265]|uniref:hypothetical protein n=1 Tax=Nonomuraea sp. NPDC052265 TaxID=3364374 RepID=UPI0037CA4AF7